MSRQSYRGIVRMLAILFVASIAFVVPTTAKQEVKPNAASARTLARNTGPLDPNSDSRLSQASASHRLIVELSSAPVSVCPAYHSSRDL